MEQVTHRRLVVGNVRMDYKLNVSKKGLVLFAIKKGQ